MRVGVTGLARLGPSARRLSSASSRLIDLEHSHGAHNYKPLPVVLDRAKGVHVWDVDGKRYLDFLSAYSAVNQVRTRLFFPPTALHALDG